MVCIVMVVWFVSCYQRTCVLCVGVGGGVGIFMFLVHVNVYAPTTSQGCFVALLLPPPRSFLETHFLSCQLWLIRQPTLTHTYVTLGF
jgi:hypothetical protein